jgi:hypothetical protein
LQIPLDAAMPLASIACNETPKTEAKMANETLERLMAGKIAG